MENPNLKPLLDEWASALIIQLQKNIQKKNLIVTQELLQSLRYELVSDGKGGTAIRIFLKQAGRLREMNIKYSSKQPPVDAIAEFVKKKGVAAFKFVPGYKPDTFPTDSVAIRRIAWGISKSRINNGRNPLPKAWLSSTIQKELVNLIVGIAGLYAESVSKEVKSNLK